MHQREDEGVTKRDIFMWEGGNSHYDSVSNVKYILHIKCKLRIREIWGIMSPPLLILMLSPPPAGRSHSIQPRRGYSGSRYGDAIHPPSVIPQNYSQREICCVGQISCGADSWFPLLTVPVLTPQTQANNTAAATCGCCCDTSCLNGIWLQKCSRSSWNDFFLLRCSLNWHC